MMDPFRKTLYDADMGKDDEPGKVGRKPRSGDEAAEKLIAFRVTGDEHEAYTAAAKAQKLSVSEWIRSSLSRIIKRAKGR